MDLWSLFRRRPAREPTAEELRQGLQAAASGSPRTLARFCRRHRQTLLQHAEALRTLPEEIRDDPSGVQQYTAALIAAAECLAQRWGDSRLLEMLVGTEEENPLLRWDRLFGDLPQLFSDLEYDQAEARLREMLAETAQFGGTAVGKYVAIGRGRLGECLFHSGRAGESAVEMSAALVLCRESGDVEGVAVYLNNLMEVHRYLGEAERAAACCEELAAELLRSGNAGEAAQAQARARRIREREPLNRIAVQEGARRLELEELNPKQEGRFQFVFERNRPQLQKAIVLTQRGCRLAAEGNHAAALELFEQASDVDPYDPDPVYQAAACLMELGAYDQARSYFDEVERLAPGWFHCRTGRWLAEQIETGQLPPEAFLLLRVLEDGGLAAPQRAELCEQGLARMEAFAPLWLLHGDALRDLDRIEEAKQAYRRGLACAQESDVEMRLLVALAGILPPDEPERRELVQRALELDGNFVAQAMARLIEVTQ